MVNTINILGFPHAYELSAPTDSSTVLVFVHGWLLSRTYWQPVIEQLASDYQCLSYDMRGFGDSQLTNGSTSDESIAKVLQRPVLEKLEAAVGAVSASSPDSTSSSLLKSNLPVSSYTPAAYAQDLALLLRQLNISRAWVIGHSLGGSVALWTADHSPETIAGVICINFGGGIYLKEDFEKFRTAGQQLIQLRRRWFACIPLMDLLLARLNVAQPIALRWGKQRLMDLLNADSEAALGTLLDSTTEAEVHLLPQVVARLRQPVFFVAGASDSVMESKYVSHLASFHTSFESCGNNVIEIRDCGHLAMVEQPQAIANNIREILANHLEA